MNTKNILVSALVALVVSLGVGAIVSVAAVNEMVSQGDKLVSAVKSIVPDQSNVGGLSERDIQAVSLKVGPTGTKVNQTNSGFCYIQAYAATIAASSTAAVDCQARAAVGGLTTASTTALAGVKFGDSVTANLSTTTAGSTFMGLQLIGVSASTTAGYISFRVANLTGTTFTWPTSGVATGTASYRTSR